MRKVTQSGFDSYLQLRTSPTLAEYAAHSAELPLGTQLAILRRRRFLSRRLAKNSMWRNPCRPVETWHDLAFIRRKPNKAIIAA